MRIFYLSESVIPSRTANSIHIMKMCQAFALNGHDITLFAHVIDNTDEDRIFDYYGIGQRFSIKSLYGPQIRYYGHFNGLIMSFLAKLIQPDLVFGRNPSGCYFSSLLGLPTIFETHGPINEAGKLTGFLFRKMIIKDSFKRLILITKSLENYYLELYPALERKIFVLPDGADILDLKQVDSAGIRVNNKFNVGYTGHLYKGKGMEIISKLARLCDFAHFHIVGGKDEDISFWKNNLEEIKNISFHGYYPHSLIPGFLKDFDVVLLPNLKTVHGNAKKDIGEWTSPLKLFEYMAAGKSIVSSDVKVLKEVLIHGYNAFMCPEKDIDKWKKTLEFLKDNPDISKKIGDQAKHDFLKKYSWTSRAQQICEQVNGL